MAEPDELTLEIARHLEVDWQYDQELLVGRCAAQAPDLGKRRQGPTLLPPERSRLLTAVGGCLWNRRGNRPLANGSESLAPYAVLVGPTGGLVSIPGTAYQLVVLLVLVMPGVVYSAVRSRLRGPTADDRDVGVRILRAMVVSAALDSLYGLILGPRLVTLAGSRNGSQTLQGFALHTRELATWAFFLLFVVPTLLACVLHGVSWRRVDRWWRWSPRRQTGYHPTPTAWDYAAPRHGGCFVRIRLSDGRFVGGWLGENAFMATYPEARDIYIDSQWRLDHDGTFLHRLDGTLGLHVSLSSADVVEWLDAPSDPVGPHSTQIDRVG
jgi:hypothetical protein